MPVKSQHPDYVGSAPVWKMMRDFAKGQRAVHAAGELYLPRLQGEKESDYQARKDRAAFYNATWRTIEGLRGMLFRKPVKFVVGAGAEEMLDDLSKDGTNAETFALHVAGEVLTVGRAGVLVDYPQGSTDGLTKQAVAELNIRPHVCLYVAESIINWSTAWQGNKTVLSRVVLAEKASVPSDDEFVDKTEDRYRVLDLANGIYRVRVFRVDANGKDQLVEPPVFPLMNGAPLPYIPFQFFGVDTLTPGIEAPPLEDLAHVNKSHYQTTADVEHGAHKTALPQPWVAGISNDTDSEGNEIAPELYMGGGHAWAFSDANTKVGMLEYTGAGLAALETRLDKKEGQMAVLGARMLEAQKKEAETAETASIHRSGEHSTLASVATTLSRGLRQCLSWFDQWAGGDGEVIAEINRKFFTRPMTPEELTALVGAWQSGAISKETLFDNLKEGEVVNDGVEFEDEETKIANAPPPVSTGTDPAADDGGGE